MRYNLSYALKGSNFPCTSNRSVPCSFVTLLSTSQERQMRETPVPVARIATWFPVVCWGGAGGAVRTSSRVRVGVGAKPLSTDL